MHVCFTQLKERMTADPGNLLPAKAVSCGVSVVKADRVQLQGGATTHRVRSQIDRIYWCDCYTHISAVVIPRWKNVQVQVRSIILSVTHNDICSYLYSCSWALTTTWWIIASHTSIIIVTAVSSIVVKSAVNQTILQSSAGHIIHQDRASSLAIAIVVVIVIWYSCSRHK